MCFSAINNKIYSRETYAHTHVRLFTKTPTVAVTIIILRERYYARIVINTVGYNRGYQPRRTGLPPTHPLARHRSNHWYRSFYGSLNNQCRANLFTRLDSHAQTHTIRTRKKKKDGWKIATRRVRNDCQRYRPLVGPAVSRSPLIPLRVELNNQTSHVNEFHYTGHGNCV